MKNRISITIGTFIVFIFGGIFLSNEQSQLPNQESPLPKKVIKQPFSNPDPKGTSVSIDSLVIDSTSAPHQQSAQKIDLKMLKKYIYQHKKPFIV